MRVAVPMISFHSNEGGKSDRIMSVDAHPEVDELVTFVTVGGNEGDVRVWSVAMKDDDDEKESAIPTFCGSLTKGHPAMSVNCARFAPDGARLASAGDRGTVCVWTGQAKAVYWRQCEENPIERTSLPHADDVYDVAWSPSGAFLVAGAIDGSTSLWHVPSKKLIRTIRDHDHYVQGVAFDSTGTLLATASTDRSVRVYPLSIGSQRIPKVDLGTPTVLRHWPSADEEMLDAPSKPIFANELQHSGFFRRLAFVPGADILDDDDDDDDDERSTDVLIAAAGFAKDNESSKFGAVAYASADLSRGPFAYLPGPDGPAAVVRVLPTPLNHGVRYFAVGFQHAVCIYKSERGHAAPVVLARGLHRAALNDLAWARDASLLIVASSDGYISFLKFQPGELGAVPDPLPPRPGPPGASGAAAAKKPTKKSDDDIIDLSKDDDAPTPPEAAADDNAENTPPAPAGAPPHAQGSGDDDPPAAGTAETSHTNHRNQENEAPAAAAAAKPSLVQPQQQPQDQPQPVKKRRIAPTLLTTTTTKTTD